ncbi:ParA family protein [Chloroflexota bacterium]
MKPYVIAVCHQKGGVAKTTTVLSLGASLAEQGHPTLLVDLDPSGNLTAGLGLNPRQVNKSATDILLGNANLAHVSKSTSIDNLSIVPSCPDMAAASHVLAVRPNYARILRRGIELGNLSSKFIIIDCPPSLAAITTTALTAADLAVVPIQCEFFSIQAINTISRYIGQVRNEYNALLSYKMLITMFDRRGKLHTQLYEKLKIYYPSAIFDTAIGFDSKLRASQIAGQPVTIFAPRTRATRQYRSFAQEINTYVQERRILQPN